MPRPIWSGSINFGLVSIPVRLVMATRSQEMRFHQIHGKDKCRVRQKLVCPGSDEEVPRDELVKGYEIAPDQYVIVQDKELEALAPRESRTILISDFVDLASIDPLYYDRPYYLLPDERAARAYKLLATAMERARKVGIARFVMRSREYLAALRPVGGAICIEIMRFADEVILPDELEGLPEEVEVSDKELKMAEQLIGAMAGEFEPRKYHDEYRQKVRELIDKKARGEEIVAQPAAAEPKGKVINLMAALEASLARSSVKPAQTPAAKPAGRRGRRKSA